jgi:hypothetical protein
MNRDTGVGLADRHALGEEEPIDRCCHKSSYAFVPALLPSTAAVDHLGRGT